jgi:hypothetical protein
MRINDEKYEDMFAIPSTSSNEYITYYIAAAYNSLALRIVTSDGQTRMTSEGKHGVRPVVSLKPEIITSGQNADGAWKIDLP